MSPDRKRTWRDAEEIGRDLHVAHPETDPLRLTDAELRRLVVTLPTFGDEPGAGTERQVEAIQAAWYDEREG